MTTRLLRGGAAFAAALVLTACSPPGPPAAAGPPPAELTDVQLIDVPDHSDLLTGCFGSTRIFVPTGSWPGVAAILYDVTCMKAGVAR